MAKSFGTLPNGQEATLCTIASGVFCPADAASIPTGEERDVEGTPYYSETVYWFYT